MPDLDKTWIQNNWGVCQRWGAEKMCERKGEEKWCAALKWGLYIFGEEEAEGRTISVRKIREKQKGVSFLKKRRCNIRDWQHKNWSVEEWFQEQALDIRVGRFEYASVKTDKERYQSLHTDWNNKEQF